MQLPLANMIERVLGLDRGFLAREGELGIDFNPHWPGGDALSRAQIWLTTSSARATTVGLPLPTLLPTTRLV